MRFSYVGPELQYQKERLKVSPEGDEHWARMMRTRKWTQAGTSLHEGLNLLLHMGPCG